MQEFCNWTKCFSYSNISMELPHLWQLPVHAHSYINMEVCHDGVDAHLKIIKNSSSSDAFFVVRHCTCYKAHLKPILMALSLSFSLLFSMELYNSLGWTLWRMKIGFFYFFVLVCCIYWLELIFFFPNILRRLKVQVGSCLAWAYFCSSLSPFALMFPS